MVVPVATPTAAPLDGSIVATEGVPLTQLPDAVGSVKVNVAPRHRLLTPTIAAGNGFTVTIAVVKHPVVGCF